MGGVALAQGPAATNASSSDSVDCTLLVPPNPLTAAGLATPYRLLAPCHEADPDTAAFVQATVIDPASGQVSVYAPLVIDETSTPAVRPVVPRLPDGAVVGIWFGFNGDNLRLRGNSGSLNTGACVNGEGDSIFGQFAYCNAPAFFNTAAAAVTAGRLHIPALGVARDNQPCPTVRDFSLVDMDQSDNVTTSYLSLPNGRIAQNTTANAAALSAQGARIEINGSDNALLDAFVDPALGCVPFTAPDLAEPGRSATSLALNELQAAAYQTAPVALVPLSDPMAQDSGGTSVAKTNRYRAGVNQSTVDMATETPVAYCQSLVGVGMPRVGADRALTRHMVSPDSGAADSLFTFLAQRLAGSFDVLSCGDMLKMRNPVHLVTRGDVVVGATFDTTAPPTARPTATQPSTTSNSPTMQPTTQSPATQPPTTRPTTTRPTTTQPTTARPTASRTRTANPSPSWTRGASPTRVASPSPTRVPSLRPRVTIKPSVAPETTLGPTQAAPVIRPPAPADTSGADDPSRESAAPSASPAAAAPAATPTDPAMTVEPMRVRAATTAATSHTGIPIPRFAGGILVGGGSVFFVGLIVYGMRGKRRRHHYLDY